MPPKKKGKGNKLARMTEEEKLRYLQHRAAIEEEARRRKEHVIASYMKNKLKHEDAFTRLNTAKINQQWRQTLRQIKNRELHDASETLRQVFEVALKTKNTIINNLSKDLEEAAKQHGLAVQTHLVAVDKILDIRERRLEALSECFKFTTERNLEQSREDRERLETAYKNDEAVLKGYINCEKSCYEKKYQDLVELGDKHRDDILHQLMAEMKHTEIEGSKKIDELKQTIKQTEDDYFDQMQPLEDQYNELLISDEKNTSYLAKNELAIKQYRRLLEKLNDENNRTVTEAKEELDSLKEFHNLQQAEQMSLQKILKEQTKESTERLKHLAKISNAALDELNKRLHTLEQINHYKECIEKLLTEKELVELAEAEVEIDPEAEEVPMIELAKFTEKYGKFQAEVTDLEITYSNCLEENSYLQELLKSTMKKLGRPTTVPSTLYRGKTTLPLLKKRSETSCQ